MSQPYLEDARVLNPADTHLGEFLIACRDNDAALALQLAPERDTGALTFGLYHAVDGGHLDLADSLLQMGAKWDARTTHVASKSLDRVKWLVQSGYDVNTGMLNGAVLLPMVVNRNDEASIRYLLEQGADPRLGPPLVDQRPPRDIRPVTNSPWMLNSAAATCTPEIFALLLSYGADITNAIPLHCAAGYGPSRYGLPTRSGIPMMEYLTGLGLDVNASDDAMKMFEHGEGQHGTPLQYAIMWGRVEEAEWLLSRGAGPDLKSVHGISARDRLERKRPEAQAPFPELFARYGKAKST